VGRRDYMGSFGGNVMILGKVRPEDVIAVPTYDANKMRVCGYHILFELSDEAARLVRSRKAFTESDEAKRLLGACLSGNHTGVLRRVVITQQKGGGIQIQNLAKPALEAKPEAKVVKAEVLNVDETHEKAPALDPKQIAQTVAADKAEKVETRADKARALYNTFKAAKAKAAKLEAAQATLAFKKQSKVGWYRLGITSEEVERLLEATKG